MLIKVQAGDASAETAHRYIEIQYEKNFVLVDYVSMLQRHYFLLYSKYRVRIVPESSNNSS